MKLMFQPTENQPLARRIAPVILNINSIPHAIKLDISRTNEEVNYEMKCVFGLCLHIHTSGPPAMQWSVR